MNKILIAIIFSLISSTSFALHYKCKALDPVISTAQNSEKFALTNITSETAQVTTDKGVKATLVRGKSGNYVGRVGDERYEFALNYKAVSLDVTFIGLLRRYVIDEKVKILSYDALCYNYQEDFKGFKKSEIDDLYY